MKYIQTLLWLLIASCSWAQTTPSPLKGYLYKVEAAIPGRTVYVCGQRPFDADGNLVGANNLVAQTQQVFENLKATLATVNLTLRDIKQISYSVRDVTSTMPGQVSAGPAQAIASLGATYVPTAQLVEMKNVPQSVRNDVYIEIEVIAVK